MDYYEMQDQIRDIVESALIDCPYVSASAIRLDERCGKVKVGDDFIAVSKDSDNRLQYYGGFEYICKEMRKQFGDWVFYEVEDDNCRVSACLEYFNANLEQEQ